MRIIVLVGLILQSKSQTAAEKAPNRTSGKDGVPYKAWATREGGITLFGVFVGLSSNRLPSWTMWWPGTASLHSKRPLHTWWELPSQMRWHLASVLSWKLLPYSSRGLSSHSRGELSLYVWWNLAAHMGRHIPCCPWHKAWHTRVGRIMKG